MSLVTLQGRPIIEKLPSGLRKISRFSKVNAEAAKVANIESEVFEAYGTADLEFTSAFLIDQRLDRRNEQGIDLTLIQVFQELSDNELVATNEVFESKTFDGRLVTRTKYICKASQADALKPDIGDGIFQVDVEKGAVAATVTVFEIEITDDGFVLSDETSYDTGDSSSYELATRSISTIGSAPDTPSGFAIVRPSTRQVDGYTVYSYTFAKGLGQVSLDTDYLQSSDSGTTGGTVITIRHLTALATGSNPTSTPSGFTLAGISQSDQSGYRVWVVKYAKGVGTVVTEVETREGGKLVVYHRVGFGSAPSAPSATISGTVVATRTNVREGDGFKIYDYEWAEGNGEVSRTTSSDNNGSLQRVVITHLTASSVSSQPTSDPLSGGVATVTSKRDEDGYRLWEVSWVKGSGEVSRSFTNAQGGPTDFDPSAPTSSKGPVRCTIRHLTASSVTSDPTSPPGSFKRVAIDYADEAGYRVWTVTFGYGVGLVVDDVSIRNGGKLRIYHRIQLGSAPSAPSAVINGTVTSIRTSVRQDDGHAVYDYEWAEGNGVASTSWRTREDGSILYVVTELAAGSTIGVGPAESTYLVAHDEDPADGYVVNRNTWIHPPENYDMPRQVRFMVPGLVEAANPPTFYPPITRTLLATAFITFSTDQNEDVPYTVNSYATLNEKYTRASDGFQYSKVEPLEGYLGDSTLELTNEDYRGIDVSSAIITVGVSDPTARPSGETILDVDCEIYLVDYYGIILYRNTSVKYTF